MEKDNRILVKDTGEIIVYEQEYIISQYEFKLPSEWSDADFGNLCSTSKFKYTMDDNSKNTDIMEGKYYLTKDGNKFHESDVVSGVAEIRNYKIKNNLEI